MSMRGRDLKRLIFPRLMHDTATSLSLEYDYGYLDIRTGNGEKTPTL